MERVGEKIEKNERNVEKIQSGKGNTIFNIFCSCSNDVLGRSQKTNRNRGNICDLIRLLSNGVPYEASIEREYTVYLNNIHLQRSILHGKISHAHSFYFFLILLSSLFLILCFFFSLSRLLYHLLFSRSTSPFFSLFPFQAFSNH